MHTPLDPGYHNALWCLKTRAVNQWLSQQKEELIWSHVSVVLSINSISTAYTDQWQLYGITKTSLGGPLPANGSHHDKWANGKRSGQRLRATCLWAKLAWTEATLLLFHPVLLNFFLPIDHRMSPIKTYHQTCISEDSIVSNRSEFS